MMFKINFNFNHNHNIKLCVSLCIRTRVKMPEVVKAEQEQPIQEKISLPKSKQGRTHTHIF